ncbi:TonB-dependent receptor plug domain-containing protein, partial [Klebsiella pneumoniae]
MEAKETPQTINVVTRQQIEDFGLTSTRDVLSNMAWGAMAAIYLPLLPAAGELVGA